MKVTLYYKDGKENSTEVAEGQFVILKHGVLVAGYLKMYSDLKAFKVEGEVSEEMTAFSKRYREVKRGNLMP